MNFLVDSNILLRLAQPGHPHCHLAQRALERLRDQDHVPRIVPQVIYEYWVVATRPAGENGLGLLIDDAKVDLAEIQEMFPPFRDERRILEHWEKLVSDFAVLGKNAHDARLVAAMQRHGVSHLLTFNEPDFARYATITVLTPQAVCEP
jgi:predicted nucleic acid-binding protein